jgi:hypothetical protein
LSDGVATALVRSSQTDTDGGGNSNSSNNYSDLKSDGDGDGDSSDDSNSSDEVAAFGARPLKRLIQNSLLSPCANHILEGSVEEGDKLLIVPRGKGADAEAALASANASADNSEEFSPFAEVYSSLGDSEVYAFYVARRLQQ